MRYTKTLVAALMAAALAGNGCQPAPKWTVLPAPTGTNTAAAHHNDEGIHAYAQGQWEAARQHFAAAITASPDLAEAHYNMGKTLYRLGATKEGDAHFISAANLAPGNKVIWDSPPLKNVYVPSKEATIPGFSDGHAGHSH
ncbi:MAG: tetratricopeptide repeat protein [Nitrospirae bacterium]|nr:MAG: tetratricopeptide repeat protein [Nitrospirota bacterium]